LYDDQPWTTYVRIEDTLTTEKHHPSTANALDLVLASVLKCNKRVCIHYKAFTFGQVFVEYGS
jgi:hypothetical protein